MASAMLPPMLAMRSKHPIRWLPGVFVLCLALAGCDDKIGDSCDFNVDCSKMGERLCDRSSPGGYCTIENCNAESCPDEATCVAFYPITFLTRPCDPMQEDMPDCTGEDCDRCTPDETCIVSGFCAPDASARRWCMFKCKKNSDCRDGYECRQTGLDGTERVAPLDEPRTTDKVARFCAPER